MIAGQYGSKLSLPQLRQRFSISLKGATLKQLIDIATEMKLGPRALRCELEDLSNLRLPAILHWNLNHFVVLEKVIRKGLVILDPGMGKRVISTDEANDKFTGVVLELTPAKDFTPETKAEKLGLFDIIPFSSGFWKAMGQALGLSLFLQFFVLLSPFFMQFIIDEAILKSDTSLLLAIAAGFALLKIFETISTLVRSLVLQYLSTIVSYDMESSVLHHLLRLPLNYFQKRAIGDIQQRFSGLQMIQSLIVNTSVATLIDGLLVITVGIALFLYNPLLASIATLTIAIYAIARLLFMNLSKRLSMDTMITDADKQSHFLGTLRAIQVIKISGLETQRESRWRNLASETLGARVKYGNVNILFQGLNGAFLGLSNILIVYLAARQAMTGALTVGMIVAFLAYKQQFETKLMALLETYINFKLLDVNLERIADVVQTEPEADEQALQTGELLQGNIELNALTFAYAPSEPVVLHNVNLSIEAGDFVVFVGPSGAGKSTLLKLIMGALDPLAGQVLFDGKDISQIGIKTLRSQLGVMMQDDSLLSGSIEQNISLFDEHVDNERLLVAVKKSAIEDDINAMPMGFMSLVGDMGTTLSGGQTQRIMLARALYRQPRILIMDEGTSQLDVATERRVNSALRSLNITRIMAAHRPETIASADRVFEVNNQEVREINYALRPARAETHAEGQS